MLKIHTDKSKKFKCTIDVEGAKISECFARLVFSTNEGYNFFFDGKIDAAGNCVVDIPSIKSVSEKTTGSVSLEVVAENTFFKPWQDSFELEPTKKVTAVIEQMEENAVEAPTKKKVQVQSVHEELSDSTESIDFITFDKYLKTKNNNN